MGAEGHPGGPAEALDEPVCARPAFRPDADQPYEARRMKKRSVTSVTDTRPSKERHELEQSMRRSGFGGSLWGARELSINEIETARWLAFACPTIADRL
jgi:hypothetical protein